MEESPQRNEAIAFRRRGRQEAAMGATETAPEQEPKHPSALGRDPTVDVQEACAGRPLGLRIMGGAAIRLGVRRN